MLPSIFLVSSATRLFWSSRVSWSPHYIQRQLKYLSLAMSKPQGLLGVSSSSRLFLICTTAAKAFGAEAGSEDRSSRWEGFGSKETSEGNPNRGGTVYTSLYVPIPSRCPHRTVLPTTSPLVLRGAAVSSEPLAQCQLDIASDSRPLRRVRKQSVWVVPACVLQVAELAVYTRGWLSTHFWQRVSYCRIYLYGSCS